MIATAVTDKGIKKNTNQDSVLIKIASTDFGDVAFCAVCDGMGGLSSGELASATVINALNNWANNILPGLLYSGFNQQTLDNQWNELLLNINNKMIGYGASLGINLGTTVVILLVVGGWYYCINVGDSRLYILNQGITQVTVDQTVVQREIQLGNISPEQAAVDARRNVLLQCVGSSRVITPEFYTGQYSGATMFMMCTDGFRHKVSEEEMFESLNPYTAKNEPIMEKNSRELVELNKNRMETDNISVLLLRAE